MDLIDRSLALFKRAKEGPTRLPSRVNIPASHVSEPKKLGPPLQPNMHYFQVSINEMFLANARQWWTKYDPMVFAGSEFIYDKKDIAVPVLVGPSMLDRFGQKQDVPEGMVFENTRVAGPHPYRGGRLALTVILYQVQKENYAQALLKVVDNTVSALDFSTAVSAYTKIAGAVLDGVEALLDLGASSPIVGYRIELDPPAGDPMDVGYFALIDCEVNPDRLWVKEERLHEGDSAEKAKPFRSADYILYSLRSAAARSDQRILPFYPLWEHTLQEAMQPTDDGWKSAKANLLTLYQTVVLSPDLTKPQIAELTDEYKTELKQRHKEAVDLGQLGDVTAAEAEGAPVMSDQSRQESLELLAM